MLALTLFIAAEKLVPHGPAISRAGAAAALLAVVFVASPAFFAQIHGT